MSLPTSVAADSPADAAAAAPERVPLRGVGRRLLVAILLFSSGVTLALTALQLWVDYERDRGAIESRIHELSQSYQDSLARSLWNVDAEQIRVQLEGILRMPDLTAATVTEVGPPGSKPALQVRIGRAPPDGAPMVWTVPLVHRDDGGTPRTLGLLTLEGTLDEVYRRLREKALVILVSQAIKTFVVSAFILFIVHRLVTRHLVAMAAHLARLDPRGRIERLVLKRAAPRQPDELDRVTQAFNRMAGELEHRLDELQAVNLALEHDIAARRSAEAAAERLAFHDPLTDLPNRRQLLERLQQEALMASRLERHGALLIVGLDHFKQVNDALGHAVGDRLLVEAGRRLHAVVRHTDLVARLGGDEFALLLVGLARDAESAARGAIATADKAREVLRAPYATGGQKLHLTASVGVALFPADAQEAEPLMRHADTALHHAKSEGRDAVHFFQPQMHAAVLTQHELENDLRQALVEQQLSLAFQPVVDGDGRLRGAEALLRWQHPRRGTVPPAEFIPVAESGPLILDLGDWVMAAAGRQLRAWHQSGRLPADFSLAVNVSPRQFHQPDFAARLLRLVEATGADPARLVLEITEGVLVRDSEAAAERLHALRQRGLRFLIDDFGTGYSSLAYLQRLPVDGLKIDRSFVRDLGREGHDDAIVEGILWIAGRFGLQVVAEGVETEGQLQHLRRHRCDAFQGYHFSRPLEPAVFEQRWLHAAPSMAGR